METKTIHTRGLLLLGGVAMGLAISWMLPNSSLVAGTSDRDDKFALLTVPVKDVEFGGVKDSAEGVFVLDFLTGQLKGAVLNSQTGKFTHAYFRNVAVDLKVDPNGTPRYAIAGGLTRLPNRGRIQMSSGVVYVAELNSGKVVAYGFPYSESNRALPPAQMIPVDYFQFRENIQ